MSEYLPARLQLVDRLPSGPRWLYEPKFDGYRGIVARDSSGRPSVLSRNGKDLGRWFPELLDLAARLAPRTVVDGEIVSPCDNGVSFTSLQRRLMVGTADRMKTAAAAPVALVAFDVLHDHADDLRALSLRQRRKRLSAIVESLAEPLLQLVTQVEDAEVAGVWLDGAMTMAGIEGVVAKRDEPYPAPNVKRWQKIRRLSTMDVMVHGYVGDPRSPRLVVGLLDGGEVRILGTTLPLSTDDAKPLGRLMEDARPSERPIWAPFDSHRYEEWFVLSVPLLAEIAYSHLDGGTLRHSARFLRWRLSQPGSITRDRRVPLV